jgi:hypothetical protein
MSKPRFFSGPPANKATAATLATLVATLFWTIAAHTFWKTMHIPDMTLYIATSTIFLTAIVGFVIPESGAYTEHNQRRLALQASAAAAAAVPDPAESANRTLEDQLLRMQELEAAKQASALEDAAVRAQAKVLSDNGKLDSDPLRAQREIS